MTFRLVPGSIRRPGRLWAMAALMILLPACMVAVAARGGDATSAVEGAVPIAATDEPLTPALELPTDRPRPPVQTYRGAVHRFGALPGVSGSSCSHARGCDGSSAHEPAGRLR